MVNQALKSADLLAQKGVEASVISLKTISPIPFDQLAEALGGIGHVVIAEEAFAEAAIHDSIACHLRALPGIRRIDCLDLGREYAPHGDMASLYKHYGLDGQSIADHILEVLKIEN
jgi:1-deoxy-D-xylulose-5-phosphate synthase